MAGLIAKKNQAKLAEKIYRSTHFSRCEVENLLNVFRVHGANQKTNKMDRTKFRTVLHNTFQMTDDILMDRIFRAFDTDNDSNISMEEWIMGLSVFLRGTLDEQARYCFNVYDLNSDGYITREEMYHMLKHSLIKQPTEEDPDEGVKDLVEIILKKMIQE
uniref:EF-hand domain-containing protein n=1 Tax=Clytia hemisphaerica TaxID=252671 RepID=A0A7M5XGS1_9CNID